MDLLTIRSDAPLSAVFAFDAASRSVRHAGLSVPWPVLFLLGYRHRKHRFLSRRLPSADDILQSSRDAVSKLKWMNYFRESSRSQIHRSLLYPRRIRNFVGKSPCDLDDICDKLRHTLIHACSCARSKRACRKKRWSNILFIEKAARDWLELSPFVPMPSDEEGSGFCFSACR